MTQDSNPDGDNENTKKESDLKKFLKKRSFIYLMCAVVFVVFFVPEMMQPSDIEKKLLENYDTDAQKAALEIIKSYRGADNEGSNLFDVIITQIENAYPTEKIFEHRDTVLEIFAVNIDKDNSSKLYEVHFVFQKFSNSRERQG